MLVAFLDVDPHVGKLPGWPIYFENSLKPPPNRTSHPIFFGKGAAVIIVIQPQKLLCVDCGWFNFLFGGRVVVGEYFVGSKFYVKLVLVDFLLVFWLKSLFVPKSISSQFMAPQSLEPKLDVNREFPTHNFQVHNSDKSVFSSRTKPELRSWFRNTKRSQLLQMSNGGKPLVVWLRLSASMIWG